MRSRQHELVPDGPAAHAPPSFREAACRMTDGTITTAAKGDSEPAMPRPDGGPEPLNRRVEIQITIGL